ncbi:MAG: hypothetical protein AAB493_00340 [Patescibacteria group bacterium]
MLGENKNLKDPERKSLTSYGAGSTDVSVTLTYTKTNKLITALFMVTDIMDKDEPLRNKLRTLGTEIISDISAISKAGFDTGKINQVLSFLDIASAINMISEMNSNILKKEFSELQQSVGEFISQKNPTWLEEFMKEDKNLAQTILFSSKTKINTANSIGHAKQTRIGVQKGSTLMKVLSDRVLTLSDVKHSRLLNSSIHSSKPSYDILKNKRRSEIISIIKNKLSLFPNLGGVTITDIKNSAKSLPADKANALVSFSEKTLQRELVSMVQDGVLYRKGSKRWSQYYL